MHNSNRAARNAAPYLRLALAFNLPYDKLCGYNFRSATIALVTHHLTYVEACRHFNGKTIKANTQRFVDFAVTMLIELSCTSYFVYYLDLLDDADALED